MNNTLDTMIQRLGNHFCGIRTLRTDGQIDRYCVDVLYGKFSYSGETLDEALRSALEDHPDGDMN